MCEIMRNIKEVQSVKVAEIYTHTHTHTHLNSADNFFINCVNIQRDALFGCFLYKGEKRCIMK